jgi:energy-converting hydrogenase Eha subunit A
VFLNRPGSYVCGGALIALKIYLLTSIVVWGFLELAIVDTQKPVWYPYYGSWLISVIAETCLLSLSISANAAPNNFEIGRFGIQGLRMLMFAAVPLGVWAVRDKDMDMEGHESERLLGAEPVQPSAYGTAPEDNSVREARAVHARMMKKIEESGSWWTYVKSFSVSLSFQIRLVTRTSYLTAKTYV